MNVHSLRFRLTAISVVLVAVGLITTGLATRYFLNQYLVGKVDQQAYSSSGAVSHFLAGDHDQGSVRALYGALPHDAWFAYISDSAGHPVVSGSIGGDNDYNAHAAAAPLGYSSVDGYRLWIQHFASDRFFPGGPGQNNGFLPAGKLVIAIPLDSTVNPTLDRLTTLELFASLIVVVIVGCLAWALVKVSMRPLREIEQTAGAIAAGDLSQRIEPGRPGTEVGRLSEALNAMLAQIEQAFREREASENRLRRFVADAGHELRTPLTSVRGYAELFRHGADRRPDDLALAMRRIEEEASRMGVLVDDLLLLARLDQGRPLEREPVDLRRVAADLVTDAHRLHPEWPLEFEDAEAPLVVTGDNLRLHQAVGNLLSNCRAHTPPGTALTVRLSSRDEMAVVEVSDTGPGIDPDIAGRVFERFVRADDSRARSSGGSGLGLSIVSSIVEAHGGRVELDSEIGKGATFRLLLPLAPTSTEAPEPAHEVPTPR
jgi:two-component system OmpR family sensor kinase